MSTTDETEIARDIARHLRSVASLLEGAGQEAEIAVRELVTWGNDISAIEALVTCARRIEKEHPAETRQADNELIAHRARYTSTGEDGGPVVREGETLWAIRSRQSGLVFAWAYTDRNFAEKMLERVRWSPADSANWRVSVVGLGISCRTKFGD